MHKIFAYQQSLMDKLAPVEISLGYTPPQVPLDFTQRQHQDWFRLMSWYLTEELVEALTATPEEKAEELADCLHFATELCILAGATPDDVEFHSRVDEYADAPWQYTLEDVLIALGMANNLLKAKHWKKNPQPTNLESFKTYLSGMLYRLVKHIEAQKLSPEDIYFAKHKKNEERIQTNY